MAGWGNTSDETVRLVTRLQQQTGRGYADADRDGRDDATGQTLNEWINIAQNEVDTRERGQAQERRLLERRQGEAYEQEYEEYVSSGQRQRDIDAGREPMAPPGSPGSPQSTWDGRGGSGYTDGRDPALRDFDEASGGIPIWGWLSGADARNAASEGERQAAMNRGMWADLGRYAPSADDLTVDYEQYDSNELGNARADQMSIDVQRDALRGLQDVYRSGGMTAADHARQQLARQQTGQATRAQRDAELAALEARGMGGSGAALAARLASQQAGVMGLSAADAQMQIEAQQRALQAMQAAGAAAGQMRGQSWQEDATRRSAIDEFNRANTDQRNRTRDSRAAARQQAYQNRERMVAGATNQYSTDVSRRQAEGQREDNANASLTNLIGTVIS
ncbi:hypothetical protein [Sandaracinus amylolyticus]|uniref:hypothetical protein n=1 Tax=Sandaracinus amylolyticus TaxID=927083 RepID=UPI001F4460A3|nr:hypothetical protein [Sandaracinus amylolyticus]UJR78931.1 Hypothetical protein I5071_9640 [Sandaracinus amylolyticus]